MSPPFRFDDPDAGVNTTERSLSPVPPYFLQDWEKLVGVFFTETHDYNYKKNKLYMLGIQMNKLSFFICYFNFY